MTNAQRQTVFIVYDGLDIRDALCILMRAAGLHATAFASARDFLYHFNQRESGCLVLDYRMPGMCHWPSRP